MDFLIDFLITLHGPMTYLVIFAILLACGLGLPIPEDITLIAAGLLAYYGIANVYVMIAVSLVGVLIGDSFVFFLGSHYGRKLTKKWIFAKILPEDRLEAVRKKIDKKGDRFLFAARFMPGLRAPIFFTAGTLHVPFRRFLLFDGLAALISVPAIVGLVHHFGDQLDVVVTFIKRFEHGILMVIVAIILMMTTKWYITHRKLKAEAARS